MESLKSEPLTKKPKLEQLDYPDVKPKLETADPNWEPGSDVQVSASYVRIHHEQLDFKRGFYCSELSVVSGNFWFWKCSLVQLSQPDISTNGPL